MGAHHVRTMLSGGVPGCCLGAVSDTDVRRLAAFSGVPGFSGHKELLYSGLVDAVLVATPHFSHATIGVDALRAGLHVLVEKPIAVHVSEARKLIRAHTDKSRVFAAMFNQRTDPAHRKIREMVRGGELGRIRRIQWTVTDWFRSQAYYDSGGWRATWAGEGGGVLLNQCVHNIDLLQWIFGMPSSLRAVCHAGRHHAIEVEDDVTALLEYEGGASGVLVTSTGEAPGVNRLEISGERGRLVFEDRRLVFLRNEVETCVHSRRTREGYEPPTCWRAEIPLPPGDRGEQHLGILKNFTNAILHGEELIAPAGEGINSLEILNAILFSGFEDRSVTLPLSPARFASFLRKRIAASRAKKKVVPYRGGTANYLSEKS